MSEQKYKKAARVIVKAGVFPFPITDTMIEILKMLISEEEIDLIMAYRRKTSQTLEQLIQSSKMAEEQILKLTKSLAKTGFIFNQPSSSGIMVYRLMPLVMVGVFEYTFMKKVEFTADEKKIAQLFGKLFEDLADFIQDNYDTISPFFENVEPYDRTVPILNKTISGNEIQISINEDIEVPEEKIMLTQDVEDIINKFDEIAVGHCFCRHHQDLLGNSCKITKLRENCFTFGKSARYCAEQGFARMISKDDAIKILKESEKDGLVHKTFHPATNISRDETSICNCCKDCCGTLEWWRMGVTPLINWTSYLSNVDESLCIGCGTCVEKCPVDAMSLNDNDKAEVNKALCIGCGVCAHFCTEDAISLLEGLRKVYDPLPKLRS